MKTQDKLDTQTTSSARARSVSRLANIGAILVVALLVGTSAAVFAFWRARHGATSAPLSGRWERVLDGYIVSSLMASQSNPSVLYACALHAQSSAITPSGPGMATPNYTLLRSTDNGSHWQEVKVALHGTCQLAISPTDSNNLYVVSLADHTASNGQVPSILKHSTNGGQTWTEILPTLSTSNTRVPVQWSVQQVSLVENRLFGIQWIPSPVSPPVDKTGDPVVAVALSASRLVESNDGGHTWSIIDNYVDTTLQGTRDYVVLPSDPQTIYELVGTSWGPVRPPVKPIPRIATDDIYGNLSLYKTTNGGGNWTRLLSGLSYGSKLQVASGKPEAIYVGGSMGIMPLVRPTVPQSDMTGTDPVPPIRQGINFLLHMSMDGGATWHDVKAPSGAALVQSWFVSADAHVYIASSSSISGPTGHPTVTRGTVVPSGTTIPGKQGQVKQGAQVTINQHVVFGDATDIQRYDPTSDKWSTITKTLAPGTLLMVTPTTRQSGAALWLLSVANGKQELYRYIL